MKVILFSLFALMSTPAVIPADDVANEQSATTANSGVVDKFDKRYSYYRRSTSTFFDTKNKVRVETKIFEMLLTTAINTPNTDTQALQELLQKIKDGKIQYNPSKEYTYMTHKDFYHRLLRYVPYYLGYSSTTSRTDIWTHTVKLNNKEVHLTVTIWGNFGEGADERVIGFVCN